MNNKETLQSYNTNLSENNDTLSSILETINNLPEAGGGTSGDAETTGQPYVFYKSLGESSDVTSITIQLKTNIISAIDAGTGVSRDNVIVLVVAWVRGEYSLSDGITLLAETDTFGSYDQKTIIGIYDINSSTDPVIYQTTAGRMGGGLVMLANCDTPEVFLNYAGPTNNSLITLETDNYLNIFHSSYTYNATGNTFFINNFEAFERKPRTTLTISSSAGTDKSIDPNGSSDQYGMIGIRCKYKRVS